MTLPVTYLFVPGDRPERFDKAVASGADAVILDLEDAVAPPAKAAARACIAAWLAQTPRGVTQLLLRVNDAASAPFADDLVLLRGIAVDGVLLPKTETPAQIAALGGAAVVPMIETARGLQAVEAIAAAPGVQRLAFGTLDFAVDLGLSGDERGLLYPASRIALASRCAGIAAPIAGVTAAIDDPAALARDLEFARATGFSAKLCIHPRQVAAVRAALGVTDDQVAWARRVLDAAASGGVAQVDGEMVDRPVLLKAQDILDRAAGTTTQGS